MTLTASQTVTLTDSAGRELGSFAIDRVDGELVLGTFTPGPDYQTVRDIFDGFAEAVECAALSVVDQFDRQIAALGIRVIVGTHTLPTRDVQIYPDGAASFRVALAGLNGVRGPVPS